MTRRDLLQENRSEILAIAQRYGVRNVRVFGSVARGDDGSDSDIDFLVDMEPGSSLLDMGGALAEWEALLGTPVDVVSGPGLRERIRERVLREAIPL
jgi:hypothetical protein